MRCAKPSRTVRRSRAWSAPFRGASSVAVARTRSARRARRCKSWSRRLIIENQRGRSRRTICQAENKLMKPKKRLPHVRHRKIKVTYCRRLASRPARSRLERLQLRSKMTSGRSGQRKCSSPFLMTQSTCPSTSKR